MINSNKLDNHNTTINHAIDLATINLGGSLLDEIH